MTPTQRENLRLLILTALESAKPYAVGLAALRVNLPQFRTLGDDELRAEVGYLMDKGFVAASRKAISPENTQWIITAEGRDYLATEGLA